MGGSCVSQRYLWGDSCQKTISIKGFLSKNGVCENIFVRKGSLWRYSCQKMVPVGGFLSEKRFLWKNSCRGWGSFGGVPCLPKVSVGGFLPENGPCGDILVRKGSLGGIPIGGGLLGGVPRLLKVPVGIFLSGKGPYKGIPVVGGPFWGGPVSPPCPRGGISCQETLSRVRRAAPRARP